MAVPHLHHLHYHRLHLLLLVQSLNLHLRRQILFSTDLFFSFPTGLIPRTLGPFNVFILLSGWICLHGVLD